CSGLNSRRLDPFCHQDLSPTPESRLAGILWKLQSQAACQSLRTWETTKSGLSCKDLISAGGAESSRSARGPSSFLEHGWCRGRGALSSSGVELFNGGLEWSLANVRWPREDHESLARGHRTASFAGLASSLSQSRLPISASTVDPSWSPHNIQSTKI